MLGLEVHLTWRHYTIKKPVLLLSSIYDLTMQEVPAHWILPDWPAPAQVRALMTSRHAGVSLPPWDTMNVGDHVGDHPAHVQSNRELLARVIKNRPVFLQQVHGVRTLRLQPSCVNDLQADACWTDGFDWACTIMVADCLPVLLCDGAGQWVAAAHAGWRGLAGQQGQGVLEVLLSDLFHAGCDVSNVLAWLGPCIGPQAFEVGPEVKAAFESGRPSASAKFMPARDGKFMADLAGLARLRLHDLGVLRVFGNDSSAAWCTASQPDLFFSHRRDSLRLRQTGRMAACIWLDT